MGNTASNKTIVDTIINNVPRKVVQETVPGNRFESLGVGKQPSGVVGEAHIDGLAQVGELRSIGNITGYYSDDRLKTKLGIIDDALAKLEQLSGFYYQGNAKAEELGFGVYREVGVSAQEVQAVLPEAVTDAPVDPEYLTVRYERLVPLLIEAVKELSERVKQLEK